MPGNGVGGLLDRGVVGAIREHFAEHRIDLGIALDADQEIQ